MLTANALDSVAVKPETLVQKLGFHRSELEAEWSAARQTLSNHWRCARGAEFERAHSIFTDWKVLDERGEMIKAARHDFTRARRRVEAALWSAISGIATGALAGLVVDLKAGGLTFGGGAILGGIGGGLSAYALIKTYSLTKGDDNRLHWSREHLREQAKLALLSYLAVAHFGRGRGPWKRDPRPGTGSTEISAVVDEQEGHPGCPSGKAPPMPSPASPAGMRTWKKPCAIWGGETLARLYPRDG